MDKNTVLVSGGVIFCMDKKNLKWMVVKYSKDGDWEIPKVVVRKVESSVRALVRVLGEQGGMSVQILEEVGRAGGVTTVNGKTLPQRYIYYLVDQKSSQGEPVGFEGVEWLTYANAVRKLTTKREKQMIRSANEMLKAWNKVKESKRDVGGETQ